MQTQIKKIIIGAAALVFAISGVSLADDRGDRHHKPERKAYGHYKAKKHQSYWNNKHLKPLRHHRDRHISEDVHHDHDYYDNHHRRWERKHFKSRRPHRNRHIYKKVLRHNDNYHRRRASRDDLIYKVALKDPSIVFKVILKEHGLF